MATRDLLSESGWDGLTLEKIAVRAEVGRQTVYRWWKAKGDVVAEAITEGYIAPFDLTVPNTPDLRADLQQALQTLIRSLNAPGTAPLVRALTAAAAASSAVAARQHHKLIEPLAGSFRARLKRAVDEGEIRADVDLDVVVDLLMGAPLQRMSTTMGPLADISAVAVDLFLGGAIARGDMVARERSDS